jgi:hypothetical protein
MHKDQTDFNMEVSRIISHAAIGVNISVFTIFLSIVIMLSSVIFCEIKLSHKNKELFSSKLEKIFGKFHKLQNLLIIRPYITMALLVLPLTLAVIAGTYLIVIDTAIKMQTTEPARQYILTTAYLIFTACLFNMINMYAISGRIKIKFHDYFKDQ